jgi:NitT/TauT family transport system ATP-binding protein
MVESLANKHVDGFCVGAPWNSVAVDLGIGYMLHFVSEILARGAEKVLALRSRWAQENPDTLSRLIRAHARAAAFIEDVENRDEVAALLAPANRIGVSADIIRRTLDGRMKIAPDGGTRVDANYLLVGRNGAGRPDPAQAAWLYAQMVRWGQAPLSEELRDAAMAVFRADLYDAVLGAAPAKIAGEPPDGIGAFAGPAFNPRDIAAHLTAWRIGRVPVG